MVTVWLAVMLAGSGAQAAELGTVFSRHVDARGRVDYAAAAADEELEAVVAALATAPEPTDPAAKMAFWINAYNVLTVDLVADHWPLGSIRDLDDGKPWDTRRFQVAGREVTLNDIEHRILRPMGDPRVHAAVNCASLGCPPLAVAPFTAGGLDAELDQASERWATTTGVQIDKAARTVKLNRIFDWYGDDFAPGATADVPGVEGKQDAAVQFLVKHLPASEATWLMAGGYTTSWAGYSWRVNQQ